MTNYQEANTKYVLSFEYSYYYCGNQLRRVLFLLQVFFCFYNLTAWKTCEAAIIEGNAQQGCHLHLMQHLCRKTSTGKTPEVHTIAPEVPHLYK